MEYQLRAAAQYGNVGKLTALLDAKIVNIEAEDGDVSGWGCCGVWLGGWVR